MYFSHSQSCGFIYLFQFCWSVLCLVVIVASQSLLQSPVQANLCQSNTNSPPVIYTASIPSRIYLPFLGNSASFGMIYSMKKGNMITPSLTVTCDNHRRHLNSFVDPISPISLGSSHGMELKIYMMKAIATRYKKSYKLLELDFYIICHFFSLYIHIIHKTEILLYDMEIIYQSNKINK